MDHKPFKNQTQKEKEKIKKEQQHGN